MNLNDSHILPEAYFAGKVSLMCMTCQISLTFTFVIFSADWIALLEILLIHAVYTDSCDVGQHNYVGIMNSTFMSTKCNIPNEMLSASTLHILTPMHCWHYAAVESVFASNHKFSCSNYTLQYVSITLAFVSKYKNTH